MPHALVLLMYPSENYRRPSPSELGRLSHGLFFELLRSLDPSIADQVHVAKRKPFTLYPWRGENSGVYLRVTLLNDTLFSPFVHQLAFGSTDYLRLGVGQYRVARVYATSQGHGQAGSDCWDDLVNSQCHTRTELRFRTPTVFATSKAGGRARYTPLPDLILIFKSLLSSWQAYSPYPLSESEVSELLNMIDQELVITRLTNINTREWSNVRSSLIGFTGTVYCKNLSDDQGLQRRISMLSRYSFYSGVGAKTTMGFGQVRPALFD